VQTLPYKFSLSRSKREACLDWLRWIWHNLSPGKVSGCLKTWNFYPAINLLDKDRANKRTKGNYQPDFVYNMGVFARNFQEFSVFSRIPCNLIPFCIQSHSELVSESILQPNKDKTLKRVQGDGYTKHASPSRQGHQKQAGLAG
jgi:hypothetical protein